jgi:hypothetical protein
MTAPKGSERAVGLNEPDRSASKAGLEELRVTRLVLRTLMAVDLGRISKGSTAKTFLRDRGRPGWLAQLEPRFTAGPHGFQKPKIRPPAYGQSEEHGRPTFSEEFSSSYMPLVFEQSHGERHDVGPLQWVVEWIKVGPTGAMSVSARADINADAGSVPVIAIVRSYHLLRRQLKAHWTSVVEPFLTLWSDALPEYSVQTELAPSLWQYLEFYDVVDFDFTVGGATIAPKTLYATGPVDVVRALAGLTRMSPVMGTYSEQSVRALVKHDLGNRPDELWIVNVERLTRHHPEHLTDIGKRLFMEDVVSGIEILLQQRATINYVSAWGRGIRATFLDRLTDESDSDRTHKAMRSLLVEMAWASDLFLETMSVDRDSGSSFFRTVISHVAALKEVDERRSEVLDSVHGLLSISQAVFGERAALASAKLQEISLSFERSSRNMGAAAVVLAIAAIIVAVLQIWIARG